MTLQELHSNGKIQWPGDARIAVLLSFDFQGGEDVRPDKNGKRTTRSIPRLNMVPKPAYIGFCAYSQPTK